MLNLPFDLSIDYFSVLGVHYGASQEQVKKAYRRMARRYHPDASKIYGAKEKFQEISNAYEILKKYREEYCRQFNLRQDGLKQQHQRAQTRSSSQTQSNGFSYDSTKSHSQQAHQNRWSGFESEKRAEQQNAYQSQSNTQTKDREHKNQGNRQQDFHSDFRSKSEDTQSGWEFESRFNRSGFHKPIDGKDRVIEYPLTLRYAIRQLKIGRFYVPGLKISMKFTRQAFDGKTFRIPGKGYRGLFGGRNGDFLVKFQIRIDEERFTLKNGDIHAKFFVADTLLKAGRTILLDTPSGRVDLLLPEGFETIPHFKIEQMGLPADDENRAGDLYIQLYGSSQANPANSDNTSAGASSSAFDHSMMQRN